MKYLLSIFFLFGLMHLHAQDSTQIKRIKISDVQIHMGMSTNIATNASAADIDKLAPGFGFDVLSNTDPSGFAYTMNNFSFNSAFSGMLGLRFSTKDKTKYNDNFLLRVGFNHIHYSPLYFSSSDEKTFSPDTLYSSQTGEIILSDSIARTSYWVEYTTEQIRLDVSVIFRTNPQARWSLYGGAGINGGVSLNSFTQVNETFMRGKRFYYENGNSTSYSIYESGSTRVKNKQSSGASVYFPLGVNVRLGNKRPFWKNLHLFYEFRPGLSFLNVPELGSTINASLSQGLGLKITW